MYELTFDAMKISSLSILKEEEEELKHNAKMLKLYTEFMTKQIKHFNEILPEIQIELKKFGFEIEKVKTFGKTGSYGNYKEFKDTDKLKADCYLKMIDRRKPIDLSSYSRSGDAQNGPKVRKIASEVKKTLKEKFNITADINCYSLDKSTGILFDIWI